MLGVRHLNPRVDKMCSALRMLRPHLGAGLGRNGTLSALRSVGAQQLLQARCQDQSVVLGKERDRSIAARHDEIVGIRPGHAAHAAGLCGQKRYPEVVRKLAEVPSGPLGVLCKAAERLFGYDVSCVTKENCVRKVVWALGVVAPYPHKAPGTCEGDGRGHDGRQKRSVVLGLMPELMHLKLVIAPTMNAKIQQSFGLGASLDFWHGSSIVTGAEQQGQCAGDAY